ncbi:RNAse h domain protein [Colletotrichum musicola]|uniref:ribonuclease H n=1 Tax=Colletotrichum musicola TaxID=2175873 RepID=A0A8H6K4H5_9PEZI|nr:RNAse h domain protein [Colletotrichum musicola]
MRLQAPRTNIAVHIYLQLRASRPPNATPATIATRRFLFWRRAQAEHDERPKTALTTILRGLLDAMPANKRGAPLASGTAPKKRKAEPKAPKFYGVRFGHIPGVYDNWAQCQKQISGCAGAMFKSFPTEQEALEYVAGKDTKKEGPPKYYAVARGPITGIYLDWKIVEEAITGAKGPKYKKFETIPEAVAYIEQWADDETIDAVRAQWDPRYEVEQEGSELEPESEVDLDVSDSDEDETKSIVIYTDGSCLGNGKTHEKSNAKDHDKGNAKAIAKGPPAAAGVGVFFGDFDKRNISEPLEGEQQTNQRAELTALLRALECIPITKPVHIWTDSSYSINCATKWYKIWEENGWKAQLTAEDRKKNITDKEVKNRDLVEAIRRKINERDTIGTLTDIQWVKAHDKTAGNIGADRLAAAGAKMKAKELSQQAAHKAHGY